MKNDIVYKNMILMKFISRIEIDFQGHWLWIVKTTWKSIDFEERSEV